MTWRRHCDEETTSGDPKISANQRRSLHLITKFKLGGGGSVDFTRYFLLYFIYLHRFVQIFNGRIYRNILGIKGTQNEVDPRFRRSRESEGSCYAGFERYWHKISKTQEIQDKGRNSGKTVFHF